jgi:hypothetical protein
MNELKENLKQKEAAEIDQLNHFLTQQKEGISYDLNFFSKWRIAIK